MILPANPQLLRSFKINESCKVRVLDYSDKKDKTDIVYAIETFKEREVFLKEETLEKLLEAMQNYKKKRINGSKNRTINTL